MGEKLDDVLGLSLSLSLGGSALKVNNMQQSLAMKSSSWNNNDLFQLPPDRTSNSDDARPFLGGIIDMDSAPLEVAAPVLDCDDDNGDNSTVSSSSGKRSEREEDNGAGAAIEFDDEDGGGSGDMPRKKLRLTKEQSMLLEEMFKQHNTLNPKQKQALAKELNLRPRQVEVWFQNRRARTKLKQTEVDCEYLKRCCENLSEDNRRLHKEVQELRALKLSPHLYMHNMNPPTTLTMCPSCESLATSSSSSGTAHSAAHPPPSNCNNLLAHNIRRPLRVNSWPFKGSISRP